MAFTSPGTIGPGYNESLSGGAPPFFGSQPRAGSVYLGDQRFGAHLDGSNDDAALAAATAAVPFGGELVLPAALIGCSSWSPRADIHYRGAGYYCFAYAPFGDPAWSRGNYGTTIGGTVLAPAATSGAAVTITDPARTVSYGSFTGIMILGPGAGTSTGLAVGGTHGAIYGNLDVMVANFYNGVQFTFVESSTFSSVRMRGIGAIGYADDSNTTNLLFNSFEAQYCATIGASIVGSGNTWIEALIQNCSGQPLLLSGNGNCFITPWLENTAASTRSSIAGNQNMWVNARAGVTNDVPAINGGSNVIVSAVSDGPAAFQVAGNGNVLLGNFGNAPAISGTGNVVLAQTGLTAAVIKGVANLLQAGVVTDAADLTFQVGDGRDSALKLMRGATEFLQLLAAAGGGSGLNNQYVLELNGASKRPLLVRHNVSGTITVALQVTGADSVTLGLTNPGVAASDGFPYIPASAGAPTGTPTAQAGFVPLYYDTTNHKLWVYDAGWKGVVVA